MNNIDLDSYDEEEDIDNCFKYIFMPRLLCVISIVLFFIGITLMLNDSYICKIIGAILLIYPYYRILKAIIEDLIDTWR